MTKKNNKIRVFTNVSGSWAYTKYIKVYPDGTQIFIDHDDNISRVRNMYTLFECLDNVASGVWKEVESEIFKADGKKSSVKKNIPKITGKVEKFSGGYYFIINFGGEIIPYFSKNYAKKYNCEKAMNNFLKMFKGF